MIERLINPIAVLRTLDFRVAQAFRKASSPPFLGLLEFSDEDREKARAAISGIGNGDENVIERVLRKYTNFAAWYLCDAVRRSYGVEGSARVWPDIAEALDIRSELSHPFRHALHDIVARRCEKLGLPVPPEDRVSLFRLHAGVSEAQLPALIRAFLAQERHFGLPQLDDGNALNEWEDNALHFVPHSLSVLRMPILWDVSAWHASVYADCRVEARQLETVHHSKFSTLIDAAQKERAATHTRTEEKARPRLVLDHMEISIRLPDGTSRQLLQFGDEPSLRVRPGTILALPLPLPNRVTFGSGISPIELMPLPGDVLIGDADLEGDIIQTRRTATLGMANIVIFAREPINGKDGSSIGSYELAEGLFTATLSLPQTGSLELLIGNSPLTLARQLSRRVSLKGGIIGRGPVGNLYSPHAFLLVRTGIAAEVMREISVSIGMEYEKTVEFSTDTAGEAVLPLSEVFEKFEGLNISGPQALRVELLRPREGDTGPALGSGVRLRADVWPDFLERIGARLMCESPPRNLSIAGSRNIFIDDAQTPCIDPEATSEAEIAFEIEGKIRRYRLPPLDLNLVQVAQDGSHRPIPIGSNLVLSQEARGGALRVRSDDSEAELEVPGRARFKPFRGGRANTISLRGLKAGWLRLHRGDGRTVDLVELREEYAFLSVAVARHHGNVSINLRLDGPVNAIRVKLESEMGETEIGDIHFGPERFLTRQPEWVMATPQASGAIDITVDGSALKPAAWLGFIYVSANAGWQPVVSTKGEILTFIASRGVAEPDSLRTAERSKRVLEWLKLNHASESWKEGGVGAALSNRKSALIRHLDTLPGGRARIIAMSLNDDWFSSGSSRMPTMQTLFDCPYMFEGSITDFYGVGGAFEALSLLESRRLRELDLIDTAAFLGFANLARAEATAEKLKGFDIKRLMQIVSLQEGYAELRWTGTPVLGTTHWRSAHILLQDRIDETGFFGDDVEGDNGKRSLNLRRLHAQAARSNEKMPVPSFLSGTQKTIHEDCSQTLRAFAVAARSRETLSWVDSMQSRSAVPHETLIGSLGDLVLLGPELFAFHLIAAELERRK